MNRAFIITLCIIILAVSFVTAQTLSTSIQEEYKNNKDKCKDKSKEYLKEDSLTKAKVCEYTDTTGKTWLVIGGI